MAPQCATEMARRCTSETALPCGDRTQKNSQPARLATIPSGNLLNLMGTNSTGVPEDDQSSQSSINSKSTATSSAAGSRFSLSSAFPRLSSAHSAASSSWMYAQPEQTLVFLDWDNTLFPTTEFSAIFSDEMEAMNGLRCKQSQADCQDSTPKLSAELEAQLELWRKAVTEYLGVIRNSCIRCRIITNSKNPWVETCIRKFHPELEQLIDCNSMLGKVDVSQHSTRVLYADEEIIEERGYSRVHFKSKLPEWLRTVVVQVV